jgi:hypothetical protein
MRKFRLLTADEIECRVQRCTEKGVQILLYKTVRVDYAILDETVGAMNWQNKYKDVDGKVYCAIGIYDDQKHDWIWKENCGSESNMEAEKGEASDAMKRAGFAWGIGTELYSSPFIWVKPDACKLEYDERSKRYFCDDRFVVTGIEYDENDNICFLAIDNTTKHCAAYISDQKYIPKEERAEKPTKSDFAEINDVRMDILSMANGDVGALGKVVEKITDGKFKSLDGMNLTQLIAVKKIIEGAKKK